jgi:hypothetical protein
MLQGQSLNGFEQRNKSFDGSSNHSSALYKTVWTACELGRSDFAVYSVLGFLQNVFDHIMAVLEANNMHCVYCIPTGQSSGLTAALANSRKKGVQRSVFSEECRFRRTSRQLSLQSALRGGGIEGMDGSFMTLSEEWRHVERFPLH